ncbi:MAG: methyltransferase [Rhodospirillales bacterium]|nr:methyltransferase [Rhodospirillales bacterium]
MDFASFDKRHYPVLGPRDGYGEWAPTYEATVLDLMDLRLLARLRCVDWPASEATIDLACGTGRVGAWLRAQGVARLDGVDLTPAMLALAEQKKRYDRLILADVTATGLGDGAYDLATQSLADEHIADLRPLYREVARLLRPGGRFVLVGYHPHFLMLGMPTHFDRASGDSVTVESHVHLFADHVTAAHEAGFVLQDMVEGVIDDAWIAAKPKWAPHRNHPISFAMVWRRG